MWSSDLLKTFAEQSSTSLDALHECMEQLHQQYNKQIEQMCGALQRQPKSMMQSLQDCEICVRRDTPTNPKV